MNRRRLPGRTGTRSILLAVFAVPLLMFSLVAGSLLPQSVRAQELVTPEDGRRVYDTAGIFTTTEVEHLEEAAARVTAAGAPTIVYIQAADRDGDETEQDAADLMEAWEVESSPGAKDGLVLFFNTDPDNLGHGQFALFAGERHYEGGNLPNKELERIISDVMTEPIGDDMPAVGLAAGLDAAANSLQYGPPPPPPPSEFEEAANTLAGWPVGIAAAVVAALTSIWAWRGWQSRPGASVQPGPTTTNLPDRLSPALAGALVTGSIGGAQAQGTMLDLAARGAISFEPSERGAKKNQKLQILLVDDTLLRSDYEREIWHTLESVAAPGGVISAKDMPKLPGRWKEANAVLRHDLESRGWWDPAAGKRRVPYYIASGVLAVAAVAALVLTIAGEQPFGAIGVGLLGFASLVAFLVGASMPALTENGAAAAAPWRGLKAGLNEARKSAQHIDYDVLLPYIMAMNQFGALQKQLKAASADGYVPLAFRQSLQSDAWTGGFYPYFVFLNHDLQPVERGNRWGIGRWSSGRGRRGERERVGCLGAKGGAAVGSPGAHGPRLARAEQYSLSEAIWVACGRGICNAIRPGPPSSMIGEAQRFVGADLCVRPAARPPESRLGTPIPARNDAVWRTGRTHRSAPTERTFVAKSHRPGILAGL